MSKVDQPPRPRLALNIGVTGHLPKDLTGANLDTLRERIREVLEFLALFASNVTEVETYYAPGKPVLRVISALAEGADRHVAHQAIDLEWELQCPLPFDRSEYLHDFSSEGSILEFKKLLLDKHTTAVLELDGVRKHEAESYQAAGRVILGLSDVLLTVWNGEVRNKKGGTSDVVGEARQRNLPTVWINSEAPHDVYVRTSDSKWSPWAVGSASLIIRLEALLRPPVSSGPDSSKPDGSKEDEEEPTLAAQYFAETQPVRNWGWLWLPFRNFFAGEKWDWPSLSLSHFDHSGRQKWKKVLKEYSAAFSKETVEIMNAACLFEHYGWADGLAVYYGNLYRSAFVFNYVLGALAVFLAFLHFAVEANDAFDAVITAIELLALWSIVRIYRKGRKGGWHERWVDYRLLAEYLRQMFFLTPLGPGELSSPHIPAHMAAGDPKTTWMYWHYRAVRRDFGMIRAKFTAAHLQSTRLFITGKDGIGGQADYHETNARRCEALDERFVQAAKGLFYLAIVAAALSFVVPHSRNIAHWLSLRLPVWFRLPSLAVVIALIAGVATVFPAFGAALAGIRSQGEFERVKKRSKAMQYWLEQISKRPEPTPGSEAPILSVELSGIAAKAGQLMVDELLDWRTVFKDRPLPEPE
jgi:hypothetical protein